MRKLGSGIALAALVVLLAACGGDDEAAPPPKPVYPDFISISGDLTLKGASFVRGNISDCAGAAQYADLVKNAPVTVSDSAGRPLAVGKIAFTIGTNVYQNRLDECTFRYYAPHVPHANRYAIQIGQQKPVYRDFLSLYRFGGVLPLKLPVTVPTTTTTFLPLTNNDPGGG